MMSGFDHKRGQVFEIDGAKIYCEITGNQKAPPLLMLHGGLGNIEDFNVMIPALTKDFKIIGIDSRGQGKSTLGSQPLTYERIQKDVNVILDKLGIGTLSVFGFSDGGIVAYRLAASSTKVDKLITLGGEWHLIDDDPVIPLYKKITTKSWREKFPQTYDAYQRLNPEADFETLVNAVVKMWLDQSPAGYPADSVKNISCPLLIMRGDEDHLVSLQSTAELRSLVKGAKFLNIALAGHMAFVEQKDIVLTAIRQFLNTKENN